MGSGYCSVTNSCCSVSSNFPRFRRATKEQISHVEWPAPENLYWPELDIGLALESIRRPDAFPLDFRGSEMQNWRQESQKNRGPSRFLAAKMNGAGNFVEGYQLDKKMKASSESLSSSDSVKFVEDEDRRTGLSVDALK